MFYRFMLDRFGESGWMVAAMSIGGVVAGLIMWLVGARFSRGIITLIAVSIGALVGLRMPHWFHVPLGAWATVTDRPNQSTLTSYEAGAGARTRAPTGSRSRRKSAAAVAGAAAGSRPEVGRCFAALAGQGES